MIYLPGSAAVAAVITLLMMMQVRRVRHRKEIERSEERYHLITELMSDYAYLCKIDDSGKRSVLWITGSFTRLTGYSPEDFKEPGFVADFSHPDDQQVIVNMFEKVVHGIADSCEIRVRTRNGKELWIHNYAVPIWDKEHTRVTHLYGTAADITRRKHDEDQMRKLATELALTEQRERHRMATFLHDSVSQTLAFAKIKLRSFERMPPDARTSASLVEVRKLSVA